MSENRCVACGAEIPEGKMVCDACNINCRQCPHFMRRETPGFEGWCKRHQVGVHNADTGTCHTRILEIRKEL